MNRKTPARRPGHLLAEQDPTTPTGATISIGDLLRGIKYGAGFLVDGDQRIGDRETWLLTGWKENGPGGQEGVNPSETYARRPSGIRDDVGAGK